MQRNKSKELNGENSMHKYQWGSTWRKANGPDTNGEKYMKKDTLKNSNGEKQIEKNKWRKIN